ncbi:hypothetical protein E3T35_06300 [Cryobacterium sp. TMT1-2-2]|uniref:hypothetical protein n=1 Tax=Cryobacterium sp. TMT1-2-2 TaxID=1259233 RepID=UPI00106D651D|nr:hypothetical protein [Cryobacterium sp. TMT1-2-2]TFD12895.1 hypothetical protein E3T35_06300 [Cryobacterium sp. TMT1-2-2]
MMIDVLVNGSPVPIDRAVFTLLLDNSVAGTYVDYDRALASGSIKLRRLEFLCRRGDIPLPLFFAPLALADAQVTAKTDKLLAGVSKDTFSIGSRAKVELRDVELIVKDLVRKQELLRRHDSTLGKNRVVGVISKAAPTPEEDAAKLMAAIGLSHEAIRACRKKGDALELMIERLEANQVLVARSVQHYMPQRLSHVKFSGMTIRDNKVPFIFLAGGDHGDQQEPVGRTIFTLALMAVLIGRRIFAPMTWDGGSAETDLGREYDIAGAMLLPAEQLRSMRPTSLDDMKRASDEFNVTASAVVVRAMRLGLIRPDAATDYLAELRSEFSQIPSGGPRSAILPENAVKRYGGRELSRRMLRALDASSISQREFCRAVCLDRLKPSQIMDLRRAVG